MDETRETTPQEKAWEAHREAARAWDRTADACHREDEEEHRASLRGENPPEDAWEPTAEAMRVALGASRTALAADLGADPEWGDILDGIEEEGLINRGYGQAAHTCREMATRHRVRGWEVVGCGL